MNEQMRRSPVRATQRATVSLLQSYIKLALLIQGLTPLAIDDRPFGADFVCSHDRHVDRLCMLPMQATHSTRCFISTLDASTHQRSPADLLNSNGSAADTNCTGKLSMRDEAYTNPHSVIAKRAGND